MTSAEVTDKTPEQIQDLLSTVSNGDELVYTLDASAEPTIIIESISSGAVANKEETDAGIVISGTSNALEGQKIQIMDGTAVVAEGLVSSEGRWSVTVENLIDGSYDLTALAPEYAHPVTGDLTPIQSISSRSLEVDTQPPDEPSFSLLSNSGDAHDNLTNAKSPLISISTDDGSSLGDDKIEIYSVSDDDLSLLKEAYIDSGSLENFEIALPKLADGSHEIMVRYFDHAQNVSESSA